MFRHTRFIGKNNNDNAIATGNVVADADGSILERLEYIQAAVATDAATNFIGVDDADNVAATTNVVANRDGSVLERLEHLLDALVDDETTNLIGVDDADNAGATTNVVANRDGTILERLEHLLDCLVDDETTNLIGVNDADNAAVTSSVVANVDGSILERLEALMDPLSGYNPFLGFGVTKVSDLADGAGTDNLFTVTGRVLITSLTGEVTTVIGGAATLKLTDTTNSVDLCAATTIDTDAVGTMYALTSIAASVLNGTGMTPIIGSVNNLTGSSHVNVRIVGDAQAALTIAQVLDAADTGNITWRLTYIPLIPGATVAAAA